MTQRTLVLALALALAGCAPGLVGLSSGVCQDADYDPSEPGDSCQDRTDSAVDAVWVAGSTVTFAYEGYAEGKYAGTYEVVAEASDGAGPLDVVATPASFELDGAVVVFDVSVSLPAEACGDVSGSVTVQQADDPVYAAFGTFSGTVVDSGGAPVPCP